MSRSNLSDRKLCNVCNKVVEVYWELLSCDKNPQGLDTSIMPPHGNKDDQGNTLCEDDYCHPTEIVVQRSIITTEYVETHCVNKRCTQCHQYLN